MLGGGISSGAAQSSVLQFENHLLQVANQVARESAFILSLTSSDEIPGSFLADCCSIFKKVSS